MIRRKLITKKQKESMEIKEKQEELRGIEVGVDKLTEADELYFLRFMPKEGMLFLGAPEDVQTLDLDE